MSVTTGQAIANAAKPRFTHARHVVLHVRPPPVFLVRTVRPEEESRRMRGVHVWRELHRRASRASLSISASIAAGSGGGSHGTGTRKYRIASTAKITASVHNAARRIRVTLRLCGPPRQH